MKKVTTLQFDKVLWLVLDSVGVGALPDAAAYGDERANTLLHAALSVPDFSLPNMAALGLGRITDVPGVPRDVGPDGHYAKMAEASPGKDTTTGHWEMAGLPMNAPFHTFTEHGFPKEIIGEFERMSGFGTIGNYAASGTEIIVALGPEHQKTGKLIVYTSADSVFQIAAHEETVPLTELYRACEVARKLLDRYNIARVIARPFVGEPGNYTRTYNRRDFSMVPPGPTVLDHLTAAGIPVVGVGKIHDIFAGKGVSKSIHTEGNSDGLARTFEAVRDLSRGLVFSNLVDFDMVYGHRRNAPGYASALQEVDTWIPRLIEALTSRGTGESDGSAGGRGLLIVTADHGCDPTAGWSTDHTREYVPLLVHHAGIAAGCGRDLGIRPTFADIGATVAAVFGVMAPSAGTVLDI